MSRAALNGNRWCACALRRRDAQGARQAPPAVLACTHERALEFVSLDELKAHALSAVS